MIPTHLRYTKSHEWISPERGTVGITDFAQHELGDITYVELPSVLREMRAGDVLATIDSVKTSAEIYAPVSGRVTEVNTALVDGENLKNVNQDPYGQGWICRLDVSDPRELAGLMDAAAYQRHVGEAKEGGSAP